MRIAASTLLLLALLMIGAGIAQFIDPATGREGQETLARFGTYFGGVEGPLLSLLTIAGLLVTLLLQNHQLALAQEDRLLARHVRMLDETWRDIKKIEGTALRRRDGRPCTLGAVFDGTIADDDVEQSGLRIASRAYLKRLGTYAKGVHLFRDNFDSYWDYEVLVARGKDALGRLQPLKDHLDNMGEQSLALIAHELEGPHAPMPPWTSRIAGRLREAMRRRHE